MPTETGLQAQRRRLQRALRSYRGAAAMTQRDVAAAMDWSTSKVIRIESGTVAVSTNDLRALLAHYRIDDAETVQDLIDVARNLKHPGPQPVADDYRADEAAATTIRQYQPLLIPDLLQTEEYLRAVAADVWQQEGAELEHLVQDRLARQQVLDRARPAEMCFILDEAVLHRTVGNRGTMPRQLEHLARLGSRRHLSIQIVPFARGAYTGMLGPFVLLDLADDSSRLYLAGRDRTELRDDPDEIGRHLDHFQQVQHKLASDPDQLQEVLATLGP